jgi:prephenate dehydratase
MRDLNLAKIESRPSPRAQGSLTSTANVWEYINFIDIEGGTCDERVRRALDNLHEFANQVLVLGSYPKFHLDLSGSQPALGGPFGM